jgi:hypothetical protein
MGILRFFSERGGDDAKRFDEAMKMAKEGLMEACEIWEDMKSQFSERGSYGERSMRYRDEHDRDYGYGERSRDSRGRWI